MSRGRVRPGVRVYDQDGQRGIVRAVGAPGAYVEWDRPRRWEWVSRDGLRRAPDDEQPGAARPPLTPTRQRGIGNVAVRVRGPGGRWVDGRVYGHDVGADGPVVLVETSHGQVSAPRSDVRQRRHRRPTAPPLTELAGELRAPERVRYGSPAAGGSTFGVVRRVDGDNVQIEGPHGLEWVTRALVYARAPKRRRR